MSTCPSITTEVGSTLLLYTDGLIETRAGDIERDLADLVATVSEHQPADGPAALVERLLQDTTPRGDDVAVLAVRLHLDPPDQHVPR